MSEADLITTLKKKLRDQMNETADHVSTGACKNMEEYSLSQLEGAKLGVEIAREIMIDDRTREITDRDDE